MSVEVEVDSERGDNPDRIYIDEVDILDIRRVTREAYHIGPRRTRHLALEFDSADDLIAAIHAYPDTKARFERVCEQSEMSHMAFLIPSLQSAVRAVGNEEGEK
jgi:hypothetical protein